MIVSHQYFFISTLSLKGKFLTFFFTLSKECTLVTKDVVLSLHYMLSSLRESAPFVPLLLLCVPSVWVSDRILFSADILNCYLGF